MKKLICLFLAITLMTSVAVISVNAEENERFTTYTTKLNKLIYVDTETDCSYEYLTTGTNSDGSEFLLINWAGGVNDELYYQVLGDYLLVNPNTVEEHKGPFFIIKDNDVYGVTEAFENGLIEVKAFYDAMVESGKSYYVKLIGDTNDDGYLNISDATFIQTKLTEGDSYYNKYSAEANLLADYNNDGRVSVMDATDIQKALVK